MEKVYKIGDSKIHGKGLIAIKDLAAGDLVGLSHINNEATPDVGAFHNHSDNANTVNVEVGNERYLIVETPIKKGEEITVNYRLQPDLEQPEDFLDKALDGGDIDYPISGEVNYVNGDRMTLQPTRSKTYANDILGQLTYEQQVGTELPIVQEGGDPNLYSFPTSKDEFSFKLDDIGHRIENYLNNPSQRAQDFSDSEDELTNIDNLRHAMASRYTAEEIGNKVKEIPYVGGFLDFIGADKLAGLIGSNALGLGHEFSSLAVDERPFLPALQETGEDAFNNLIGSIIGSTNMSSEEKDKMITYLSHNNLLPDGYVKTEEGFSDDVYFKNADGSRKQNGGDLPKAQTGYGNLFKPKTNSVQIGSGIGGNTIFRDIKGLDKANLFHNQWYTHPNYINQIRNRNQWNLRDFNQNLIYSGENSVYPLVHKSGLVKDGDGNFTLATDQIDPIAAKFSMENYQTGTIPDDYYWIDYAGSPKNQFTPVKQGENLYEKFPFAMGMNFVNSNRLNAENLKMHGLWDEYRTKTKEIPKNLKGVWNSEFIPSWKKPWMMAKRATYPARNYLSNSFTIGGHAQAFEPANKYTSGVRGSGSSLDWKRFAPSFNAQSGFTDLPYTGTIGMNYSFLDKLFPNDQVSTVVHERGHLLDNQGGIYPNKYRHMFDDAIDWSFNTKGGKIGEKFGAGADGRINMFNMKPYYTDPTEQYARMMEERFRLGLTPGDEYTLDMFNQNPKMFGMGDYLLKDKDGVPVNFIKNMNTIFKEGGSLLKAQDGITEFEINKHGHIETEKGYDEEALFNFVKDKYNKVDTTTQKNDLVTKLNSPAFRERYRKNVFNITGENLSEEELTNRINQQSDFTGAGPSFHVTMPYITRSSGKGYMRNTTPYISPFAGTGADGKRIGLQGNLSWMSNQGLYQQKNKTGFDGSLFGSDYYDQVTNHDFPELAQYPYVPQLNLYRDPYSMGNNQVRSHDNQGNTIVHEYAHSYNTGDSPLFSPLGKYFTDLDRDEEDADGNIIRKGTYREIPGEKYKGWLSNLFGEDYFDPSQNQYGTWAMHPWEISSIKSETEAQLKNNNIWDHTKGEFTEANLDKMIKNDSRIDIGGHGRDPLNRMGYTALERMHYNNKRSLDKQDEANYILDNYPNDYIQDNIINAGDDASMDMDTFNTIFNNSQSNLKDRQKYSDYNALLEDYNGRNKRKKERATEVINAIHKAVRDQINQGYKKENEKFQIEYNKKKGEVLPKLEMYFNEIAMENGDQPIMARDGGSLPKAQSGLFKFKPRTKSGTITNIADDINLYGYNYAKDAFGNTGAMLSGSVHVPTDYARSIRNFRGLQNTSEYDPSTRFLMNEYTVDSAPFKFSEQDWLDNPSGWHASTLLGADGKPLHISDNSLALALSNKIQGNNVIWKNPTNQELPINLTRNFNLGQNTLTGIHGDINQLRELYKSGDPYQLGSITSWGIGNTGLKQFGSDRYVIKDFDTKYPALLNEYKGLTDNQAKTWRERELLLDNPTFKVTNIIENAPRLPDWRITTSPETVLKGTLGASDWKIGEDMWKNTGDGNVITHFDPFNKYILGKRNPYYESLQHISRTDPKFRIKAIPNYGTDIELNIIKKKGGEIMKKPKYQDSPFTKGKITYSDPTKILNDLISQGIFTSEFKMGGEKKLNNGFTVKKQFDNNKNIPYVTYMNEPNIEGRIYYDSDSSENLDDFNVIDVETELIKRKIKHKRTKDIILKYESGDELSNAERAHLNSLGLLD